MVNAISLDRFKDTTAIYSYFRPIVVICCQAANHILPDRISSCFRLVNTCFLRFNPRRKHSPEYPASSARGILRGPFKVTGVGTSLRGW